jgi:hypothetical protein
MLVSAVFQLQPENLGIDADVSSAVSVLRNWREQSPLFGSDVDGFSEASLSSIPAGWLKEAQRKEILSPEFTAPDALFIRNSLLTATMARYAAGERQTELDRGVALFDFAMRTVALQNSSLPQLPFPLYEIILLGQGTPDDRAWVFAALLKQQRIDTVILQARDDPEAKLVGVILDGEVYLFDTRLGLPIPRADDPPSAHITRPATWNEMKEHPEWWQMLTLRADQPYPWNTEQLESADVFMYSAPESWSTRMRQLESVLPASSLCVLSDPLVEPSPGGIAVESLAKRMAKGNAEWTPDKLRFWSHPLNLADRLKALGQQAQQLTLVFQRFTVPLDMKFNENGQLVSAKPSLQHQKCRTEQLLGKFNEATNHFLSIRHLAVEALPQELRANPQQGQQIQQFYLWAASDASYWSAACKIEQGEYESAVGALQDYLRRYARLGTDWVSAAQWQLALALAELGKFSEARAVIAAMAPDDPHRPGLEILMKRWTGLEEPKTDDETKPADALEEPES